MVELAFEGAYIEGESIDVNFECIGRVPKTVVAGGIVGRSVDWRDVVGIVVARGVGCVDAIVVGEGFPVEVRAGSYLSSYYVWAARAKGGAFGSGLSYGVGKFVVGVAKMAVNVAEAKGGASASGLELVEYVGLHRGMGGGFGA